VGESCVNECTLTSGMVVLIGSKFKVVAKLAVVVN